MASVDRRRDWGERVVLAAFVAFAATPFVFAAAHASFWQRHSPAPPATALGAALLVALVTRRRWAWLLLVLSYGFVVVSFAWKWGSTVLFVVDLIALALLVSAPMRRYVGRRVPRTARRPTD
jgi:Na+/proline symporter